MAQASVEATTRFYCYKCEEEVRPNLADYTCTICQSGCIQEMEAQEPHDRSATSYGDGGNQRPIEAWEGVRFDVLNVGGALHHMHAHLPHDRNAGGIQESQNSNDQNGFGRPNAIEIFIQQLFSNLGVHAAGGDGSMPGFPNFASIFSGNMNDYAWGPDGIDNIITQLLNQLENVGAPPADAERVSSLPIEKITASDIDRHTTCSVCLDEFTLGLTVKMLPCNHRFHCLCIETWLSKHDSCPVCRKNLNGTVYTDAN